jgi:leucyl/phenylalanyl-tRNA--protein transferase
MGLHWIRDGDPPDAFPQPASALREPNGLLAAGGDLDPARLIAAYRRGIFPWFSADQPPLWWCPDPRAILEPASFHLSRSLRRRLRRGDFEVSVDLAFDAIIGLCASTRADSGTWISAAMISAYTQLHSSGHAHSIEAWQDGALAGGLYGINLGGVFFGESMVSLRPDASKLVAIARRTGIALIDCQVPNPHLARLGSRTMPRSRFLSFLAEQLDQPPLTRLQKEPRHTTTALAQL